MQIKPYVYSSIGFVVGTFGTLVFLFYYLTYYTTNKLLIYSLFGLVAGIGVALLFLFYYLTRHPSKPFLYGLRGFFIGIVATLVLSAFIV